MSNPKLHRAEILIPETAREYQELAAPIVLDTPFGALAFINATETWALFDYHVDNAPYLVINHIPHKVSLVLTREPGGIWKHNVAKDFESVNRFDGVLYNGGASTSVLRQVREKLVPHLAAWLLTDPAALAQYRKYVVRNWDDEARRAETELLRLWNEIQEQRKIITSAEHRIATLGQEK